MERVRSIRSGASIAVAVAVISASLGCAALRLNGCRRVEICGEQGAYVCGTDAVCADQRGNTIRSEPVSNRPVGCRICGGHG
jgi:hypothetical protein